MSLRVTMLGSGTSSGVPMIGCDCPVCTSQDPRNRRTRTSALLRLPDRTGASERERIVVVDTGVDFRRQALDARLDRLDAVLFTHSHADHIFGLDDVRVFNFRQRGAIPCYGSTTTLAALRRCFAYVFEDTQEGGGKPLLDLRPVREAFDLWGHRVVPVPVFHGSMEVFGYRLGSFAYVTDCNALPESSFELLEGVTTLILGALRYRPHPTHFSFQEALEVVERLRPERTFFTHIAHDVDHTAPEVALPEGVAIGFDGLSIDVA